MLPLPTGRAVNTGVSSLGARRPLTRSGRLVLGGSSGLEYLPRQPGYTQPDHESGRATPGARVSSGVVINLFLNLFMTTPCGSATNPGRAKAQPRLPP